MAGPSEKSIIRVFVSSPSDVMAERERVDRIAQRLNAAFAGVVEIHALRWENSAYTADSTFQRQIADPGACDIVVSIFWQRLGSELPADFERMPDGRPYPSGTVYELSKALQASARSPGGLPYVLVYRKLADVAVPMMDRDRYRQAHQQREAFLTFWEEWFVSAQGHFKAAYNTFDTTDDFESKFDAHLREWLRASGYATRSTVWSLAEQGSPFRGLEPFDASHEEVFFGRTRDVDRALERLGRKGASGRRFLLLIGESGSGKSSLARAGIFPRVLRGALGGEPAAWRAAIMRPGGAATPLLALAEALFDPAALPEIAAGDFSAPAALAGIMSSTSGMAARPVTNALDRIAAELRQRLGSDEAPGGGLVIVVDQLEELVAPGVDAAQRERFADSLDELAATGRVVVVATLRSDAYPELTRSPALLALKEAGDALDVTTPGAAEIAEIVRAPAAAAGLSFGQADTAGERLDDVIVRAASGRDALPLLQFTLSRLYEAMRDRLLAAGKSLASAAPADLVLTFEDYQAFGGFEGAIGERAEEAFGALGADAQQRLPRLLRALAEVEPAEDRPGPGLRLFEVGWETAASDVPSAALVQALVDARILVASHEGTGGERRVRFAHEAVLRTWRRAQAIVAEHREFFRIRAEVVSAQRRFARQKAERGGRGADAFLLPRGLPLAEAESIRERFADELPPDIVAFIDQSGRKSRRRQRLLMAATIVFALTALGAGAGAFLAMRSEERASRNFDLAIAQADALVSKISEELKDLAVSRDALRRILSAIERQFEAIAAVNRDHPRLLLSRARMLTAFVDNYLDLGETGEAARRAEDCIAITRGLVARHPDDLKMVAALGACLERQGTALRDRGQVAEAIKAYQESLALRRSHAAADPDATLPQRDLADGMRQLAYALVTAGRNDESLATVDEGLAIARRLATAGPDDPVSLRLLCDSLNVRAIVLAQLRRPQDALASYQEAIAGARRLVALDASNATWKRYLSNTLANSSAELVALERPQEGLAVLQESLALRRGLVALDPGHMTWQRELSYTLVEYGSLLTSLKRVEEALTAYRESIGIVRRLIEIDSGNVAWKNELRRKLPPVVALLMSLGNRGEALAVLQEGVVLWRESIAANPNDLIQAFELGWLSNYVGNLLHVLDRHEEALDAYREALAHMARFAAAQPGEAEAQRLLATITASIGRTTLRFGRRQEAVEHFRRSVAIYRRVVPELDQSAEAAIEMIETLRALAALEDAPRPLLEEALRHLRTLEGRGELNDEQKKWIAEIEEALSQLP